MGTDGRGGFAGLGVGTTGNDFGGAQLAVVSRRTWTNEGSRFDVSLDMWFAWH